MTLSEWYLSIRTHWEALPEPVRGWMIGSLSFLEFDIPGRFSVGPDVSRGYQEGMVVGYNLAFEVMDQILRNEPDYRERRRLCAERIAEHRRANATDSSTPA